MTKIQICTRERNYYKQNCKYSADTAYYIALCNNLTRYFNRGRMAFNGARAESSSDMAINTLLRSTILFMRVIRTETNAATAPRRKAGAIACEITCEI